MRSTKEAFTRRYVFIWLLLKTRVYDKNRGGGQNPKQMQKRRRKWKMLRTQWQPWEYSALPQEDLLQGEQVTGTPEATLWNHHWVHSKATLSWAAPSQWLTWWGTRAGPFLWMWDTSTRRLWLQDSPAARLRFSSWTSCLDSLLSMVPKQPCDLKALPAFCLSSLFHSQVFWYISCTNKSSQRTRTHRPHL